MYPYEDPAGRVPVLQLNSELQQAQLELLSAHCATHQLRLHYSAADLARFGRRDILEKSAQAASALNEFYASIEKKLTLPENHPVASQPTPAQIAQGVAWVSTYLQEQRDYYFPASGPLSPQQKASLWPYFSPALLDQVRVVELHGARVAVPEFFAQARALGFEPPEITHMDSITFLDVIVFNEELSERALFHALVHTAQIQILGLERYAQLWIHSYIKSRTHFTVPLEVHAFSLASKFLHPTAERFSVEDQILRWVDDNRY
ncbi:MAG: hypothetical protein WCF26_24375 [Candidatus Sulfotelmatobacter sp.]